MTFWWRKDRGHCLMCLRPLGRRKLSHFIEPPPLCLDDHETCQSLFALRVVYGEERA